MRKGGSIFTERTGSWRSWKPLRKRIAKKAGSRRLTSPIAGDQRHGRIQSLPTVSSTSATWVHCGATTSKQPNNGHGAIRSAAFPPARFAKSLDRRAIKKPTLPSQPFAKKLTDSLLGASEKRKREYGLGSSRRRDGYAPDRMVTAQASTPTRHVSQNKGPG